MKRVNRSRVDMLAAWGEPSVGFVSECERLIQNGLSRDKVVLLWCVVNEFANRRKLWRESYAVIESATVGADYLAVPRRDGSSLSFDDKVMMGVVSDVEVDKFELSW